MKRINQRPSALSASAILISLLFATLPAAAVPLAYGFDFGPGGGSGSFTVAPPTPAQGAVIPLGGLSDFFWAIPDIGAFGLGDLDQFSSGPWDDINGLLGADFQFHLRPFAHSDGGLGDWFCNDCSGGDAGFAILAEGAHTEARIERRQNGIFPLATVPEPSSMLLTLLGTGFLVRRRFTHTR